LVIHVLRVQSTGFVNVKLFHFNILLIDSPYVCVLYHLNAGGA
jgi:hypothetical protein